MEKEKSYRVEKIYGRKKAIEVEVPGSKSITNRALLMAALADGESRLKGALFSDDSRDMMTALRGFGVEFFEDEGKREILVKGRGGKFSLKEGEIFVGNSGITARFITVLAAFSGGRFRLVSGEQMKKRPMMELIHALRKLGVKIVCEEEEGHFPLLLEAGEIQNKRIEIDTEVSSQFLSALLMSSCLLPEGLEIAYSGRKSVLPYVDITLRVMEDFQLRVIREEGRMKIEKRSLPKAREYEIEPDVSSACYFYSLAVLLGVSVTVKGVHLNSMQGDVRFLLLLKRFGASLVEEKEGVRLSFDGETYPGVDVDLNAFSDQTMTLAALALFAKSFTKIRGVRHIRMQESDRLRAIYNEVIRLGAGAELSEDGITIFPPLEEERDILIETYGDHRMAMAFTLVGLRRGGLRINNPSCVRKSFENYFELIENITKE